MAIALPSEIELFFNNKRKNDVDNFAKPILDCMSEIVYIDDRQIVELTVKKFYYKTNPRIIINIREQAPT